MRIDHVRRRVAVVIDVKQGLRAADAQPDRAGATGGGAVEGEGLVPRHQRIGVDPRKLDPVAPATPAPSKPLDQVDAECRVLSR